MDRRLIFLLAGVSSIVISSSAAAQEAKAGADDATLGEIVVTARRKSESLQEVPQAVSAVTGDAIQKLNILQFQDIQAVVPGLALTSPNNNGLFNNASMRGVSYDVISGAAPTVAFYLNDVPVEGNFIFQALYDVGQVEVLRGPQGTTRGIASPSGAITLTTRRPDLSEFGGYVNVTATDQHARSADGAINLPIVKDVLALRVAGIIDQNDLGGIRSVNNALRPRSVTGAVRTSLSFEPNDRLNANIVWQHIDKKLSSFTQVEGPGNGLNGPTITSGDRLSVQDQPTVAKQHTDLVTAQFDSRIFGQHLSYVGSYQHFKVDIQAAQDTGNQIPGSEFYQTTHTVAESTTQELRLASDPAPGRFLDYTVGAYYSWSSVGGFASQPATFLPGAFGPPGTFSFAAFNPSFQIPLSILTPSFQQETSFFGSLTAHLGENTELTGGVRHIFHNGKGSASLVLGDGLIAVALPFNCAAIGFKSTYPGSCDIPIKGGTVLTNLSRRPSNTPTIYNLSLSHHFSRDLLVYANTGSSWRPGPTQIGINNGLNSPELNALTFLSPETSKAYEVGLKSTFLDGRARLNVALFRQKFHNLINRTQPLPYLSNTTGNPANDTIGTFAFTNNANALVEGFDVDGAFQITPNWSLTGALSYADGRLSNASVPCRDSNFDGVPDAGTPTVAQFQAAGEVIALCKSNGSISQQPLWNATLQSEYFHPIAEGMDGFIRGLFSYYPKNNRQTAATVINPYSTLNLYAGVRSQDGAWEVSLFAKNAFKTDQTLDQGVDPQALSATTSFPQVLPSGYVLSSFTPRREVGVTVHYAFGSR